MSVRGGRIAQITKRLIYPRGRPYVVYLNAPD